MLLRQRLLVEQLVGGSSDELLRVTCLKHCPPTLPTPHQGLPLDTLTSPTVNLQDAVISAADTALPPEALVLFRILFASEAELQ